MDFVGTNIIHFEVDTLLISIVNSSVYRSCWLVIFTILFTETHFSRIW